MNKTQKLELRDLRRECHWALIKVAREQGFTVPITGDRSQWKAAITRTTMEVAQVLGWQTGLTTRQIRGLFTALEFTEYLGLSNQAIEVVVNQHRGGA